MTHDEWCTQNDCPKHTCSELTCKICERLFNSAYRAGLLAAAEMDACKGGECHGMACSSCLRTTIRAAAEEVGK